MFTVIALGATLTLGIILGRLTARRHIRHLHRHLRIAQYAATHDELTGLPNRIIAVHAVATSHEHGEPTAVVLLDLDGFKHVNDTYGHHAGDELLRHVAARLAQQAATHHGTAVRLGGDEFVLILPADDIDPADVVGSILRHLAQPTLLHTAAGAVTVTPIASAGIATVDGGTGPITDGFATALHHADIALYHAKQAPGRHRTFTPQLRMPANAGRHGPRLRDRVQQPSEESGQQHNRRARGEATA